jgi:hypothetical protein
MSILTAYNLSKLHAHVPHDRGCPAHLRGCFTSATGIQTDPDLALRLEHNK